MVHHKPSSRSSQKSLIDVHLVPAFGPFQLKDIQLEMIQEFVNGSSKSPKTVKNIIAIMMVMWDMAMAWGYVRHNPFPRGINGRLLLRDATHPPGRRRTASRWRKRWPSSTRRRASGRRSSVSWPKQECGREKSPASGVTPSEIAGYQLPRAFGARKCRLRSRMRPCGASQSHRHWPAN